LTTQKEQFWKIWKFS